MTACVVLVALVAAATWLSTRSLLIFVLGGAFIGTVVGTILKGTSEAVTALSDKGRTGGGSRSVPRHPLGNGVSLQFAVRGTRFSVSARS